MKTLILLIITTCSAWAQWEVVDSVSFSVRIPADNNCYIYYNYPAESLYVSELPSKVIQVAEDAVDYAPDWLQIELEDNLSRLDSFYQDLYANMILNAQDPLVDEISFCIAHLAPQTLINSQFYPDVLLENAEYLYRNDSVLDYVEIIDSGSAAIGGNYSSTTCYNVCENGDTTTYYLPKDIYYWFIVNPKLQEELPTYIEPSSGTPTPPPTGKFWRNYLFNHADAGYSLLSDTLAGFEIFWNCVPNNPDSNEAIGRLTRWINTVQPWGSAHYPRLPQPVYQYHWHTGTCSEHGWFANGAGRTVLIPTTLSVAYRYNHKWNEFYDRRWIQWETINGWIDHYPYDHWGSGDNIQGCFNWRGDGYIWSITERYTPVCTLKVHVEDNQGNPVDGARVTINSPGYPGPWVTLSWTTSSGDCQILLGDSVAYFTGAIQSSLGNISATTIITNSQPNTLYNWDPVLSGTISRLPILSDTLPTNPLEDYKFEYTVAVPNEILYGTNSIDGNTFSDFSHSGNVDFFICDHVNFISYVSGDSFSAFNINEDAFYIDSSFVIPTEDAWYIVLTNEDQIVNKSVVTITVYLLKNTTGISERVPIIEQPGDFQILQNHTINNIRFTYYLPNEDQVSIKIYDLQGRLIRTLVNTTRERGSHSVDWYYQDISSGIYFMHFITSNQNLTKKLTLLR